MSNEWELVDVGLLGSTIIDADLWVWDTTAETRLDVRLVLLETNATSWSYNKLNTNMKLECVDVGGWMIEIDSSFQRFFQERSVRLNNLLLPIFD